MSKLAINENIVNLHFPVKVTGRDVEHYYDENRESVAFDTEEELDAFLYEQPERIKGSMRQFGLCQVAVKTPDGVTLDQFEDRVDTTEAAMAIIEFAGLLVKALSTAEFIEVLDNVVIGLQGMVIAKEEGGE